MNKPSGKRRVKEIVINGKWCKSCGICVEICPKNVLQMEYLVACVVNLDACILCGQCEIACPDFCIEVIPDDADDNRQDKE